MNGTGYCCQNQHGSQYYHNAICEVFNIKEKGQVTHHYQQACLKNINMSLNL